MAFRGWHTNSSLSSSPASVSAISRGVKAAGENSNKNGVGENSGEIRAGYDRRDFARYGLGLVSYFYACVRKRLSASFQLKNVCSSRGFEFTSLFSFGGDSENCVCFSRFVPGKSLTISFRAVFIGFFHLF